MYSNIDNTMAADALAPYVPRSSAAMILNMQVTRIIVFFGESF